MPAAKGSARTPLGPTFVYQSIPPISIFVCNPNLLSNLAKLDDGLAESPTVMVGDKNNKTTL